MLELKAYKIRTKVIPMGKPKSANYLQKQLAEAQARENHYRTKPAPPDGAPVTPRGASNDFFYRSLLQRSGTDPVIYRVSVLETTIGAGGISAADAGLKTSLEANEVALRLRGSGVKPSLMSWYIGDSNPQRKRTPYGTSWIRYYSDTGSNVHKSTPISTASGSLTPDDIQEKFDDLFGPTSPRRETLLGSRNGRANLTFERAPLAYQT